MKTKKNISIIGVLFLIILILTMISFAQEEVPAQKQEQKSILEQEVEIPENLQFLARVLFGLKPETKVTFQEFIILVSTFVIFFFIIREIMVVVPFFDTTIKSIIGAILVTLLVGISGGFLLFVYLILSLTSFFEILERWPIITIVLTYIILFSLGFILNKVLTQLKQKSRIEAAKIEGLKTGAATKLVQQQATILEK